MNITTKFGYDQHVKHRLTGFEGFVVGIVVRPNSVEYEVLPFTDRESNWRSSVWIEERYLDEVVDKHCAQIKKQS